jgi:hypothetical protein
VIGGDFGEMRGYLALIAEQRGLALFEQLSKPGEKRPRLVRQPGRKLLCLAVERLAKTGGLLEQFVRRLGVIGVQRGGERRALQAENRLQRVGAAKRRVDVVEDMGHVRAKTAQRGLARLQVGAQRVAHRVQFRFGFCGQVAQRIERRSVECVSMLGRRHLGSRGLLRRAQCGQGLGGLGEVSVQRGALRLQRLPLGRLGRVARDLGQVRRQRRTLLLKSGLGGFDVRRRAGRERHRERAAEMVGFGARGHGFGQHRVEPFGAFAAHAVYAVEKPEA